MAAVRFAVPILLVSLLAAPAGAAVPKSLFAHVWSAEGLSGVEGDFMLFLPSGVFMRGDCARGHEIGSWSETARGISWTTESGTILAEPIRIEGRTLFVGSGDYVDVWEAVGGSTICPALIQ